MKETGVINIIGAGIAGLSTALTLKHRGVEYRLFERNSEITYDTVGIGLSANVFPILESWSLLNEVKQIGAEIKTFHFVDKKLKNVKTFALKHPALSVNRKALYALFTERLGNADLYLNSSKTIQDFSTTDIVICADGMQSQTRKIIHPNIMLRSSNQILWRGIAELKLNEPFHNAYHDFIGNNFRFAIIHTGGNYYSWYAIKEIEETEIYKNDKVFLKALFSDYAPVVNDVIDATQEIYSSILFDIKPKDRRNTNWFVDNKVMIGDAIHPITPNMANGACLAIEDAYILANQLCSSELSNDEIFKQFQIQRTLKIDTIVNQSWLLGKVLHQKNNFGDYLIKMGVVATPNFVFNKIYSKVLV